MKNIFICLLPLLIFLNCAKDDAEQFQSNLTIFFVGDPHGQLDNFAKIKHIIDAEKKKTNVIVACSGDVFSGNPVVDNYPEKGYPIIDVMNQVGFNVSVLGNHEFDYGEAILKERMEQSNFDWVCANIDMGNTGVPEPLEYTTISVGNLKVTFLGLLETYGKPGATIPATHPWRVENLIFEKPEDAINRYSSIKSQEDADLYVALTHLGHLNFDGELADFILANEYPYFDLIIGGHTNLLLDTIINGSPVFQSGNYLNYLAKIELNVQSKKIESYAYELIDLNAYNEFDPEINTLIKDYNEEMSGLNEVIGYAHSFHEKPKVGCFYTDAIKVGLEVDVSIQNTGGIRSILEEGDISLKSIFEISPFNNGTIIYEMSVTAIKNFFIGTGRGFYYSGIQIEQVNEDIEIRDMDGNLLSDNLMLTVGLNDYIPAVYDSWFPTNGTTQSLTDAETVIYYLGNENDQVDYPSCDRYFRYE